MQEPNLYDNQVSDIIEAQNGNKSAMEKLINNNNGLIWSIVKRFMDRGYETEDLYQVAVIGFMRAIKKFDTSFEVKLSTYAVPYILGDIRRYIQTDGTIRVSRSIKELSYKISEVEKEYIKVGKEVNLEEIASKIGVSKEDVVLALESRKPINSIYEGDDEDGLSIMEKLSSNIDEQTLITNKLTISELIENLEEREKQVILLRYFRGKTQTEVAKVMGVNQVQISRIERRVLEFMKRKLTDSDAITA